jgi:hypothetical protein
MVMKQQNTSAFIVQCQFENFALVDNRCGNSAFADFVFVDDADVCMIVFLPSRLHRLFPLPQKFL